MKKNTNKLFVMAGLFALCMTASFLLGFAGENAVADTPVRKKISLTYR